MSETKTQRSVLGKAVVSSTASCAGLFLKALGHSIDPTPRSNIETGSTRLLGHPPIRLHQHLAPQYLLCCVHSVLQQLCPRDWRGTHYSSAVRVRAKVQICRAVNNIHGAMGIHTGLHPCHPA